jgi:hypothetical protein
MYAIALAIFKFIEVLFISQNNNIEWSDFTENIRKFRVQHIITPRLYGGG